jgi:hypothetical protein
VYSALKGEDGVSMSGCYTRACWWFIAFTVSNVRSHLDWDDSGPVAIAWARVLAAGSSRWMLTSCSNKSDGYRSGS